MHPILGSSQNRIALRAQAIASRVPGQRELVRGLVLVRVWDIP
jgi:hypothetical protein